MSEERTVTTSQAPEPIDLWKLVAEFLYGLRKLWWVVLILVVLFGAWFGMRSRRTYAPSYTAQATVAVRMSGNASSSYNISTTKEMATMLPYLISNGLLNEEIKADMDMSYVPGRISVKMIPDTNWLTFSVAGSDPEMCYRVLQSVLKTYPKVAQFVVGKTDFDILDETGVPEAATSRTTYQNNAIIKGAVIGLVIGIAIIILYLFLHRTAKTREDLKKYVNLEEYGNLPYIPEKKRSKKTKHTLSTLANERTPQAYREAVHKLQVRVRKMMEENGYKTLLISSPTAGEGKSTVSANLGASMARAGMHVILVDCDLRSPSMADVFLEEEAHPNLGDVIRDKVFWKDAIVTKYKSSGKGNHGSLRVLFGGKPSRDDAGLLGTPNMRNLIRSLEAEADIVILDCAPSAIVSDASVLSRFVDTSLFVIKCDYASVYQIQDGVRTLSASGTDIAGFIFNGEKYGGSGSYGRYGRYGYGGYNHYSRYGYYGHYSHYSHYKKDNYYGQEPGTTDSSGRVYKE